MEAEKKNYYKVALVFVLCFLARLIPFRAPNVEPILAATMPLGKISGAFMASFFAIFSILLYDLATHTFGVQTFFTAGAYGLVGLLSAIYFRNRKASALNFVCFAILGTLFFDAFTGLTVGPIFFHQSFLGSLVGQIPFTALHLAGNIAFAFVLSPAIYHFMIKKKRVKIIPLPVVSNLNPKII